MAILYTFNKYKDVYTLGNDNPTPMGYTIRRATCDATEVVQIGLIQPDTTVELSFKMDGLYNIQLDLESERLDMAPIKFYNNLLNSFITTAEKILCGCAKCDECKECNECNEYLNSFMTAFGFTSLNYPLYENYLSLIIQDSYCDFSDSVLCMLKNEKIYGNATGKEAMLRIISYYYSAFYYKDLFQAVDQEEKDYITAKYKFIKLNSCIKKLGTDPSDIISEFEANVKVYYWQADNIEDDITTIGPAINPTFLSLTANQPLAVFEAGFIVPYTNIGRIAFAISPTSAQNFLIMDSLNNDVTDEFDIEYNPTLDLVLFVSKIPYSYSNIYFKFKKL